MNDTKNLAHFEAFYPQETREKELTKLFEYLKKGNSSQVVGLPGAGRSTILSLLSYNKLIREKYLQENVNWFHFVYMDFSEIKGRNLFEVIKFILISLSYSLSERKMDHEHEIVNSFLKEGLEFNDELILFQSLKKSIDFLAIEKELSIVFLFDRFDQYIPDISPEFFSHLKVLRNRAKYRFSSVFSLNRPLQDIIEPTLLGEFYEYLIDNIIYVSLYDPIGTDFRFSYIEKVSGKKLDTTMKERLIHITGGHGKLLKLSYEALLAEDTLPKEIQAFLIQKTNITGALYEIWLSLLPEEQHFLRNSLENNKKTTKHEYLEQSGLLSHGHVTIPLLVDFLYSLPISKIQEQIVFNGEKNEVYKGSVALSETLSPSEFRLLRYLVQNKDKICEKEEIINAIWRDQATQEGVTDQALDQIVYRLRKKIESDPNNPTHIHTIKGRGYKFTS